MPHGMKEILKRILGYFGAKSREKQGPSLLGMETESHRDVPDAETIRKAVEEAKEVLIKNKK
jgi:hypothetical protein